MKKLILILLVCSCTFSIYAQETTVQDGKAKVKDDKGKVKDEDGKMKVKDKPDATRDPEGKTKIKDDKVKYKDPEGKVKVKEANTNNGSMSSGTMNGSGSMSTTTTVNITTMELAPVPATLPVVGNNVSPEVVATLKNKYGSSIYDIKQIKATSGQSIYVVRVFENGTTRTDYVGADGSIVTQ